jgi:hypothetical protein
MAYTPLQGDWATWSAAFAVGSITLMSGDDYTAERPNGVIPPDHPALSDMAAAGTIAKFAMAANSSNEEFRTPLLGLDLTLLKNLVCRYDSVNLDDSTTTARIRLLTSGSTLNFSTINSDNPFAYPPVGYDGYIAHATDPFDTTSVMSQWSTGTGPVDQANVERLILQLTTNSNASTDNAIVYMFDWLQDYSTSTTVSFSWDDAHESQYTYMYPAAAAANIPQSLAIIFDDGVNGIGRGSYLSQSELDEMYANINIDVMGHSIDNFQTMTAEAVRDYLDDIVLPAIASYSSKGGHQAFAYANGGFRQTTDSVEIRDILESRGFTYARTTQTANYTAEGGSVDQQLRRPSLALGQNAGQVADAASALAEINRAVAADLSIHFNGHQLVDAVPSGGLEWNSDEWVQLLADINALGASVTPQSFVQEGVSLGYLVPQVGAPTLTDPYTVQVLDLGATGSIDFGTNWAGASTFNITNMPNWMTQVGTTGVVNYTDTTWGGQYSENSIGGGNWFMEIEAIDTTGLLTASTGIWVYIRP